MKIEGESMDNKIDLVRAFMQFEGNLRLNMICTNYNLQGGVQFSGHNNKTKKRIEIVISKEQLENIDECNTVEEIYKAYKEMQYF